MAKWAFLNDNFVAEKNTKLHFSDLAFQRGYGIFDFFRLAGHQPLFLHDHLTRFFASAAGMHLTVPLPAEALETAIFDLIKRNDLPNTGIRLSLTGGYSEDGFNPTNANLVLSQHPFSPPTTTQVQKGIRLFTYPYQRQLPHIKSIDYLMAVWLQPQRSKAGADDILYHQNGSITESPRSNFFLVTSDERIITPANNVLAGITRKKLLQLAGKHFAVEERDITMKELANAKEAFLTSTTKQILPVAQVDDTFFQEQKITHWLLERFHAAYCLA